MKRFCISSVLFLLSAIALIVASAVFIRSKAAHRSLLGMQPVKLQRLAELPGRRIVFIGGSNLSHGLSSPLIEEELGMDVVNMGVHAGLGLRYIMWATIDKIHAGDIVAIVPEYGHFGNNFYGKDVLIPMVFDVMPEHKRLLSAKQWQSMIEFLPRYGASKLFHIYACLAGDQTPPINDYNIQGDYIPGPQEQPLPDNKGFGKATAADLWPETITQINEYINRCRSNGATVVFIPPVLQRTSYERQIPFIDAIAKALEENSTPFIVSPENMVLDDEFFYDTPFHLNVRGYPIRTRRVIAALRAMLQN